jgi:nicotinate-nucleotide adenylyltransferase
MPLPDRIDLPHKRGTRVAFFGGSFDPPHLGHLAVARAARAAFLLDEVLFAPVGAQPLKVDGATASFDDRLAMTKLAVEDERGFTVTLADAPKPGASRGFAPNYTFETLEGLRASLAPDAQLYCLMGADSFLSLRQWHRAAEIPFLASLIVASRPGQPLERLTAALPPGVTLEDAPEKIHGGSEIEVRSYIVKNERGDHAPFYVLAGLDVPISATEIRQGIREGIQSESGAGKTGSSPVPPAVRDYIAQHDLYRSRAR